MLTDCLINVFIMIFTEVQLILSEPLRQRFKTPFGFLQAIGPTHVTFDIHIKPTYGNKHI